MENLNQTVGKIYARMADAMAEIQAVGKESKNKEQGFMFRGIDAVMNELHDILAKHRIFILQELIEATHEPRTTSKGGLQTHHFNKIKYSFTTDDGSSVSVVVIGESADSGDKGANKCMATALKYALTQVFCIPTEDIGEPKDPDAHSHEFAATRNARNEAQKLKDDAEGEVKSVNPSWRMTEIHFGKNKGIKLVDLDGNSLKWYQDKWVPKEWKGQFSTKDLALRAALDESMKACAEQKPDFDDEVPYEWSDKWQDAVVIEGELTGKKLGDLAHEQRMAIYNQFKPKINTSTTPAALQLKKALVEWRAEYEKTL